MFLPQSDVARDTASQGSPLLIYGWLMQFALAVLPYLYRRAFRPERAATLGGNPPTLLAANAGAVLYLVGLLLPGASAALHGLAFAAWALAMLPIAVQLWRTVQSGAEPATFAIAPVQTDVAPER